MRAISKKDEALKVVISVMGNTRRKLRKAVYPSQVDYYNKELDRWKLVLEAVKFYNYEEDEDE